MQEAPYEAFQSPSFGKGFYITRGVCNKTAATWWVCFTSILFIRTIYSRMMDDAINPTILLDGRNENHEKNKECGS
jgi:hypothetical protein